MLCYSNGIPESSMACGCECAGRERQANRPMRSLLNEVKHGREDEHERD